MPIAAGACRFLPKKKQEQASTASIDAILKNNVSQRTSYACGPDAKLTDDADTAFKNAYKAAPEFLRGQFPEAAIIRHQQMDEVQKICEDAGNKNPQFTQNETLKKQLSMLLACSVAETLPGQTDLRPVIHLYNDPIVIYNNLIRTMAWTYSALPDGLKEASKKQAKQDEKVTAFLNRFTDMRKLLAQAVFVDLRNMGPPGEEVIKGYEVYRTGDKEVIDSPLLQNFLLSEITDSFYCSADSNKEFFQYRFMTSVCRFQEFAELFGRPYFAREGDKIRYCPAEATATPAAAATPVATTPAPTPTVAAFHHH